MAFHVYVIACGDGSFYVGHTDDLERRWAQHAEAQDPACYTYRRAPLELVFASEHETRVEAIERERQLKGWTRAKKAALVRGDFGELRRLARRPSTSFGAPRLTSLRTNGKG